MTRSRARAVPATLVFACLVAAATDAAGGDFPGQAPDRRIIRIQEKVDSLFENGKYERAMFIYRQELAPLGDKYAQYMVGYMHLAGKGVDEDVVTALAWFRLAAEREQDTFVGARDSLVALLTEEQQARAAAIYASLRAELGDVVLMARLVETDLQTLSDRRPLSTGSMDVSGRSSFDREKSMQITADRVAARMEYLEQYLNRDATATDAERQLVRDLAARASLALRDFEANR